MHGCRGDSVPAIEACGYLNTFDTHGNGRDLLWAGFRGVEGVFVHLGGSARERHRKQRLVTVGTGFDPAELDKVRLYFIPDGGRVFVEGTEPQTGKEAKWVRESHGANSTTRLDIRDLKYIDVNMSTMEGKVLAYKWESDCVEEWDAKAGRKLF